MNKNIGDMTESELKDFIVELQEENSRYERINQKYKEVIEKAIDYLETHKRKDEFLELNQWGTRELLKILRGEINERK